MPVIDTLATWPAQSTWGEWLDRFAVCVREVDYAAARPFWHPDIVIFGTYQELVKSLSAWTERQWDNVWPRTAEFRFDLANTMVMAALARRRPGELTPTLLVDTRLPDPAPRRGYD